MTLEANEEAVRFRPESQMRCERNGISAAFPIIPERAASSKFMEFPGAAMLRVVKFGGLQTAPDIDAISSRIVNTSHVRLELLRCPSQSTVHWRAARQELSLILVRGRNHESRITFSDGPSERIDSGRAKFWFFPDGVGALGELSGMGPFDCAAINVDPSVVPWTLKASFTRPLSGLTHESLLRAFDRLAKDLKGPEHVVHLVAEGWVLRALAHVARASLEPKPWRPRAGGLAPWQLRRATELLRADLTEKQPLEQIAAACRLSLSQFRRAFKQSMGAPPHQWAMNARINIARDLLLCSTLPLVEIASTCGFSDQSHFGRIFEHFEGVSPGVWRRQRQGGCVTPT
jgi:AraC-like DNA-binding protein